MKLKHYMRGVGTGVLFASFIFLIIVIPRHERDIEEQIRAEYENIVPSPTPGSLSNILNPVDDQNQDITPGGEDDPSASNAPEPSDSPTPVPSSSPTPATDSSPTPAPSSSPTPAPSNSPTPAPSNSPIPTPSNAPTPTPAVTPAAEGNEATGEDNSEGEYIIIGIYRGMSSEQFSEKAMNLGIVEDAEELNRYLVTNNHSDYICVGDFRIRAGASYSEIASIVTNIDNAIYD